MKKIFLLISYIVLIVILTNNLSFSENRSFFLKKGNEFYEKGDYNNAIKYFKKIIKDKNYANGYVFYNIGTAYLKEHKIGNALFWFNKSKYFIPLDRDLLKNIQIAKSKVKDDIEDRTIYNYLSSIFFLNKLMSIKTIFYLSLILFYLFMLFIILTLIIYNQKVIRNIKRAICISGILFLIFIMNFLYSYYELNFLKVGYISRKTAALKNDFNKNAKNLAILHDGTKIYILDTTKEFIHVKTANGIDGWILKKSVVF